MVKQNIGSWDRVLRLIVGAILIVLTLSGVIGHWGWLGIIPIATAVFNFCPLYRVLGLGTR